MEYASAPASGSVHNPFELVTKFVTIVRNRAFVVLTTFLCGLVAVALIFFFIPRTYQADSRVLIVAEPDGRAPSVNSVDLPLVATSTAVLSRVLDDIKEPLTLIGLKHALKAKVSDRSSIMDITFQDTSPDRAIAVPNAVADELSSYYNSLVSDRADASLHNLDAAVAETQTRLRRVNADLAEISARYPFLAGDKPLDAISTQLSALQEERAVAYATMVGDQAVEAAVSPGSPAMAQIARHERLDSDAMYGQLIGVTSKDAAVLAVDKAVFSSRYPGLASLQQKLAAERADVQREEQHRVSSPDAFSPSQAQSMLAAAKAAATVTGDRTRVSQLDTLIAADNSDIHAYQVANARIAELKMQQNAAQADFLALAARRTAAIANRAESLSLGSLVVVDRAVKADTTVVGVGRVHLAVILTLLVALVSLAAAPVADMLDPRIRRAKQVERLYGVPLITTLGESV